MHAWDSCSADCQVFYFFLHFVTQLPDSRHTGTLTPLGSLTKAKQTGEQPKAEVTGGGGDRRTEVTGAPSFRSTERKQMI